MTSNQRKKHLIIWSVLLVIIPILFLLTSKQKISYLSEKKMQVSSPSIQWTIKSQRLFLEIHTPFKSPSALLFIISNGGKEIFLGEVTQRDHYKFSIPKNNKSIKIIDAFSKEVLYESQL